MGGGPRRRWRRGHTGAGGCREAPGLRQPAGELGAEEVFPSPGPRERGRERPPRECVPVSRHRVDRAAGGSWGLYDYAPLSPSSMPALEAAVLCTMWYNIILL